MTVSDSPVSPLLDEGRALHRAGRHDAALARYDAALAHAPDDARALALKGVLLAQTGRGGEGEALLRRAAGLAPADAKILANLATVLMGTGRTGEAAALYRDALALAPDDAELLYNAAGALAAEGDLEGARVHLERARDLAPDHAHILANLGNVYRQLDRLEDSLPPLERAVAGMPDNAAIRHSLGMTLARLRRYPEARAAFREALRIDRGFVRAAARLYMCGMESCDWSERAALAGNFERLIDGGGAALAELSPLVALYLPTGQSRLDAVARARAAQLSRGLPDGVPARAPGPGAAARVLHVGYLSPDFGRHPVGYLTADLFARHDRARVRVSAFALEPPDGSDVAEAIARGVDERVVFAGLSPAAAAAEIGARGVDVLVDLGGFTHATRPEILAQRPAPLQVGWLGFCGSGGGLVDATVLDATMLGEGEARPDEAVAIVPGSFMPLGLFARPHDEAGSRADHGLPEGATILCAFNAPAKIDPATFEAWMTILARVPDAVLWLREHGDLTTANLRGHAAAAGIDPARLAFAPHAPDMARHLARHRLADFFLDTFVYGAHSTAADAIAAGLPVLTLAGPALPARVGASLCRAAGLDDWVTHTPAAYVERAVALAGTPGEVRTAFALLERLHADGAGPFDNAAFVRKLEAAFRALWRHACAGTLAPGRRIDIPPTERDIA